MRKRGVDIVGIRHHSPACARLVEARIAASRPRYVLIEGPSDFNPRLAELRLAHRLPIALYSYIRTSNGPAQCWYPFLDYSPEWVALQQGFASGASVHFIDLPHWSWRAAVETRRRNADAKPRSGDRYLEVIERLCRRFGCDGDNALWDHLFETAGAELAQRLDLYFAELRGEPGIDDGDRRDAAENAAREAHMAAWIAAAAARGDGEVLVVCGGWHRPALERLWPTRVSDGVWPDAPPPGDPEQAGCYLVPYEFRQVEALGGYGAGMQSPLFYQWCWESGRDSAIERGLARIVERLRAHRVGVSTAEQIALQATLAGLARLRGHAPPTRVDLLDAVQNALIREALNQPAPWSERGTLGSADHPLLREALLALTGDDAGRLAPDTPLPPLVHDVEQQLDALALTPTTQARTVILDRRDPATRARAVALWRLKLLQIDAVRLTALGAPNAARGLAETLRFEEHWSLQRTPHWHAQLIEASVHGATLEVAAENALLHGLASPGEVIPPGGLVEALGQALRAGYPQLGERLAAELTRRTPDWHALGELADACRRLLDLATTGFWGEDAQVLLAAPLQLLGERLLWQIDGRQGDAGGLAIEGDVAAVRCLDEMIRLAPADFPADFALATLTCIARRPGVPPALRGAALGVVHRRDALAADPLAAQAEVLALTRAAPPRDALGDFLYGLFATARERVSADDAILRAVHAAITELDVGDFLIALPQLRAAFGWFPPRERGAIAARLANFLGLHGSAQHRLLRLPESPAQLLAGKEIEATAMHWAREIGLEAPAQSSAPTPVALAGKGVS